MKQFSISLALIFLAALGVMVFLGSLPLIIFLAIVGLSLITYLIYWWDKSAARDGRRRIPETTLHLVSIFGGWPGALVAQQILRHKTYKQPFRWVFWLTVLMNIGVLVWLFN